MSSQHICGFCQRAVLKRFLEPGQSYLQIFNDKINKELLHFRPLNKIIHDANPSYFCTIRSEGTWLVKTLPSLNASFTYLASTIKLKRSNEKIIIRITLEA